MRGAIKTVHVGESFMRRLYTDPVVSASMEKENGEEREKERREGERKRGSIRSRVKIAGNVPPRRGTT